MIEIVYLWLKSDSQSYHRFKPKTDIWKFDVGCVFMWHYGVKVQFGGPELYKKRGGTISRRIFNLPRIFRSSSLNLHTFHLVNFVFWRQIFTCKHGKSTPNDRQDHHVLVVDVIMTSQCRCMRALSQWHVAKHDNNVPLTPLIGSGTGCHVNATAAVWQII